MALAAGRLTRFQGPEVDWCSIPLSYFLCVSYNACLAPHSMYVFIKGSLWCVYTVSGLENQPFVRLSHPSQGITYHNFTILRAYSALNIGQETPLIVVKVYIHQDGYILPFLRRQFGRRQQYNPDLGRWFFNHIHLQLGFPGSHQLSHFVTVVDFMLGGNSKNILSCCCHNEINCWETLGGRNAVLLL